MLVIVGEFDSTSIIYSDEAVGAVFVAHVSNRRPWIECPEYSLVEISNPNLAAPIKESGLNSISCIKRTDERTVRTVHKCVQLSCVRSRFDNQPTAVGKAL